ncbi:MAG: energy transducer TonB [Bacteroidales bacterium]|nr:energy transducer TonB [Bacteroidales bacterium]MBR4146784.1 energy transducer TonB [Bacteroidales bacterium]
MAKGKQTCKILKEIRKQIAEDNDINLVIEECTYQGDCQGTCPRCEAEVRYLERELEKRQRMGKVAVIAGMSLGTMLTASSCTHVVPPPTGIVPNPNAPECPNDSVPDDTIPDDAYLLEGDVLAPEPDSTEMDSDEDEFGRLEGEPAVSDSNEKTVLDECVAPVMGEVADPEREVFTIVEQMPEFPGGQDSLDKYIKENMRYGEMISKYQADAIGRIFVNFIVEPDGSITNVKVVRGIYEHYDEEAVRVVKSMPRWKPGKQYGKPVRVSYTIPVVFKWY